MLNGGRRAWSDGLHWGSPHVDWEVCTVLFVLNSGTSVSKESAWSAGDMDLIPALKMPEKEMANLSSSLLENPMDRGPLEAYSPRDCRNQMLLSNQTTVTACIPFLAV